MFNKLDRYKLLIIFILFFPLSATADKPIRFGILAVIPPSRIHAVWQPFINYFSKQTGRKFEIVIPRGFKKMKDAAVAGEVDFFYVNSLVFYSLKQNGKAIAVGQMESLDGKTTSVSKIFVRADSGIETIDQLNGKSIAFVSPMASGGYLAPRSYLYSRGIKTKNQTKEIFTRNLSNSIHQVLLGEINAGSMCGIKYRLMGEKINMGELKVIGHTPPYPESVIAVRSNFDNAFVEKFKEILMAMPDNPEGKKVLQAMSEMKINRFVAYDAKNEEITKKLLSVAEFN